MYKIEKQIPIPEGSGMGAVRKYPFREMEIGDSFDTGSVAPSKVRCAASAYGSRHNTKYTVRIDAASGGYRCWRVS